MAETVSMVCVLIDASPIEDSQPEGNQEINPLTKTEFLPKEEVFDDDPLTDRLLEVFEQRKAQGWFHSRGKFQRILGHAEYVIVVKDELGKAVGFALITDNSGEDWFIDYVMSDSSPEYKKRGIPRAIFTQIRDKASDHADIKELRLQCSQGMVKTYRQFGFQEEIPVTK